MVFKSINLELLLRTCILYHDYNLVKQKHLILVPNRHLFEEYFIGIARFGKHLCSSQLSLNGADGFYSYNFNYGEGTVTLRRFGSSLTIKLVVANSESDVYQIMGETFSTIGMVHTYHGLPTPSFDALHSMSLRIMNREFIGFYDIVGGYDALNG